MWLLLPFSVLSALSSKQLCNSNKLLLWWYIKWVDNRKWHSWAVLQNADEDVVRCEGNERRNKQKKTNRPNRNNSNSTGNRLSPFYSITEQQQQQQQLKTQQKKNTKKKYYIRLQARSFQCFFFALFPSRHIIYNKWCVVCYFFFAVAVFCRRVFGPTRYVRVRHSTAHFSHQPASINTILYAWIWIYTHHALAVIIFNQ